MNGPTPEEQAAATRQPSGTPEQMVSEVAKAYYPRAVAAADAARTRAQAGYAIASAIAAALVAAGLFADIEDRDWVVQGLGVLALAAWLLAGFLFMVAVSQRRKDPDENEDPQRLKVHPSAKAFVNWVMSDAKAERKAVEDHRDRAVFVTAFAMLLTVATIVGVLTDQPGDPAKTGTFTLFAAGQATVDEVCTQAASPLTGSVDPGKLKNEFVPIEVDAGKCLQEAATLSLRKKHIAAVALQ